MRRLLNLFLPVLLILMLLSPVTAQDKAITVSWPQEPDSLNSLYTTMTFAGYTIQLFLAPAWNFDDDYNANPVLVSEIPSIENGGISEDGTTFTLRLKDGLTWSDGDPLDSADFVFTYEMIVSENNSPLTVTPYDEIASMEAPDEQTVVITFDEPFAPWLSLFPFVLPEHVLQPVYDEEGTLDNAAFNRNPSVSSGPYIFQEWDTGNFMRFTANPNFVGGEPIIDTIVLTFIPDDTTYINSLATGQTQLGTFIPANQLPTLEDAGLGVEVIPSGYNEGWFLNVNPETAHPAMLEPAVREAIALGIDREAIARDLLLDRVAPAATYWDNTPYASPDVSYVPYDPERAAMLLDEAGWVDSDGDGIRDQDGVDLRLRYATTTRQLRQDVQAVAQQQLGEIGVAIDIINYESNVYFNGYTDGGPVATGDYDIGQWSSSPDFPDPNTSRFTCAEIPTPDSPSGGNWTGYCNEELDALFEAQQTTPDTAARIEIFHDITEFMADEYFWVGLWQDPDFWAVGQDLVDVRLNGTTPFWDVVNWDVAQ